MSLRISAHMGSTRDSALTSLTLDIEAFENATSMLLLVPAHITGMCSGGYGYKTQVYLKVNTTEAYWQFKQMFISESIVSG